MVTLVWIVGITNAFNLLDNMDGLCAGVAMVAALSMAVLYTGYDTTAISVAMIIAGSCGAFWSIILIRLPFSWGIVAALSSVLPLRS
jgi:UDP-N-acetylmuramyl pentapeptide phosphotransferase/UDP-N-acetylglucosamine-1-phosphate transferase